MMLLVISVVVLVSVLLLFLIRQSNKPSEEVTRAFSPPWSGRVVKVMDGDTLRALNGDTEEKIRLFGVDSPEKAQNMGDKAREFSAAFCLDKIATITAVSRKDLYGRTIGIVAVDGKVLNEELLRNGFAWWYQSLAKSRKDYEALQQEAKKARVGVWANADSLAPWIWRKQHKGIIGRAISWVKAEDCYYD